MCENGIVECLPDEYSWFADQIAGHHPSVIKNGKREIGLLKRHGTDRILKLKQDARRGKSEVCLYEMMAETLRNKSNKDKDEICGEYAKTSEVNGKSKHKGTQNLSASCSSLFPDVRTEDLLGLARLTPEYFGMKQLDVDGGCNTPVPRLVRCVCVGYSRPAILDIKMGRYTFDPLASEAKKRKESEKYPPQLTMGYRLLGYRIHQEDSSVVVKDKDWGKSHNETNIVKGLSEFFNNSARGKDPLITSEVLAKLQKVLCWSQSQTSLHFYASSLLFLYETTPDLEPNVQLYMIDFSHVFSSNGTHDDNYLHGLKSLISHIKQI